MCAGRWPTTCVGWFHRLLFPSPLGLATFFYSSRGSHRGSAGGSVTLCPRVLFFLFVPPFRFSFICFFFWTSVLFRRIRNCVFTFRTCPFKWGRRREVQSSCAHLLLTSLHLLSLPFFFIFWSSLSKNSARLFVSRALRKRERDREKDRERETERGRGSGDQISLFWLGVSPSQVVWCSENMSTGPSESWNQPEWSDGWPSWRRGGEKRNRLLAGRGSRKTAVELGLTCGLIHTWSHLLTCFRCVWWRPTCCLGSYKKIYLFIC